MNYSKYFIQKTRDNGESFFCLNDLAPECLKELMFETHHEFFNGAMPNDWIYGQVWSAFIDLESDKIEDINIEADIYYSTLYNWLNVPMAHDYCDRAIEEGLTDGKSLTSILQAGNLMAKNDIYHKVNDFLERRKEPTNGLE